MSLIYSFMEIILLNIFTFLLLEFHNSDGKNVLLQLDAKIPAQVEGICPLKGTKSSQAPYNESVVKKEQKALQNLDQCKSIYAEPSFPFNSKVLFTSCLTFCPLDLIKS